MSVAIPFHKHTVGRTFIAALTILGIGAVVQFGAMSWLFLYALSRYGDRRCERSLRGSGVRSGSGLREFADPFAGLSQLSIQRRYSQRRHRRLRAPHPCR